MPMTINTNVVSLNAQRNLSTSQNFARDLDGAPVLGPARQFRRRTMPPAWRSPTA